jgi:hypothetical protein
MTPEQTVIKNFELFKTQTSKLGPKAGKLLEFIDANSERIMLAPASSKIEYNCCHVGGLVEHSLRVLQNAAKLRQVYNQTESISTPSLILCSLFHDIGKIGTENKDYYIENTSKWHRETLGQLYVITDKLQHVPVSQLSLWWLSKQSVDLDIDEWYSISAIGNKHRQEELPTQGEPWITVILQQAIKSACLMGKGKTKVNSIQ